MRPTALVATSMRALSPLLAVLVLVASAGASHAQAPTVNNYGTALGECPNDPRACSLYAKASIEVGPLTVTVEANVENGTMEEEAALRVAPGQQGSLTFSLLANVSSNGETINATVRVNETEGIAWTNGTARNVSFVASPGFPHRETFTFRVNEDAAAGASALTFDIVMGNETGSGAVGLLVAHPEEARAPTPFLPVAGLLALVVLAALGRPTGRRER